MGPYWPQYMTHYELRYWVQWLASCWAHHGPHYVLVWNMSLHLHAVNFDPNFVRPQVGLRTLLLNICSQSLSSPYSHIAAILRTTRPLCVWVCVCARVCLCVCGSDSRRWAIEAAWWNMVWGRTLASLLLFVVWSIRFVGRWWLLLSVWWSFLEIPCKRVLWHCYGPDIQQLEANTCYLNWNTCAVTVLQFGSMCFKMCIARWEIICVCASVCVCVHIWWHILSSLFIFFYAYMEQFTVTACTVEADSRLLAPTPWTWHSLIPTFEYEAPPFFLFFLIYLDRFLHAYSDDFLGSVGL
jgi:hypothetical protein